MKDANESERFNDAAMMDSSVPSLCRKSRSYGLKNSHSGKISVPMVSEDEGGFAERFPYWRACERYERKGQLSAADRETFEFMLTARRDRRAYGDEFKMSIPADIRRR